MLRSLAAFCYRRRRLVLGIWIVALIGVSVLGKAEGGELAKTFNLPGSESQHAFDVLKQNFSGGDQGQLVFRAKNGSIHDPAVESAVNNVIAQLKAIPNNHLQGVVSPYDTTPQARSQISRNGDIAYAQLQFDVQSNDVPQALATHMRSMVAKANTPNVQIELGGSMFTDQTQPKSEVIGIFAAAFILLIAFGSVLAMGLPIMTALFGIGIGLAIVELLARVLTVPTFAPQVTALIGIGVGIDYALFISTRYREALHEGREPEDAVVHSLNTSGRAVLFAGGTVIISMLGLFFIGFSFIRALAVGASLAVLFVMLAAVTLLPAVLGFVGRTIDKWALPGARKRSENVENSFWARWSRQVQARPWPLAIGGLLILVLLAVPFFSLRLGVSDSGNDPTKFTTRRAYDLLSQGFGPGFNGPLLVVSELGGAPQANTAAMGRLQQTIARDPDVAFVSPVIPSQNGKAVLLSVVPKGSPQDASTTELVHRLRDRTIPEVTQGSTLDVHVGSPTAIGVDLADKIGQRLPYMFIAILLLSFLLLMLVFRSLLVPLKAVIMNLLSIGAAYGVIVAIFQWGWVKGALGIGKQGPIEAWVPMMLFAIVFGLSMDYEVFLLSRIKEEYDVTRDNATAVSHGLAKTARLITAAAAIMICVFGSFVLSDLRVLKLVGFGLAFAVFIDATVVRLVLVPSTMELLGDRNWWFPKWLEWLPRINVEGEAPPVDEPARELEPVAGD
jgi:RND superfamily putative drug exporter